MTCQVSTISLCERLFFAALARSPHGLAAAAVSKLPSRGLTDGPPAATMKDELFPKPAR